MSECSRHQHGPLRGVEISHRSRQVDGLVIHPHLDLIAELHLQLFARGLQTRLRQSHVDIVLLARAVIEPKQKAGLAWCFAVDHDRARADRHGFRNLRRGDRDAIDIHRRIDHMRHSGSNLNLLEGWSGVGPQNAGAHGQTGEQQEIYQRASRDKAAASLKFASDKCSVIGSHCGIT